MATTAFAAVPARLILRLSSSRPRPLAAVPALLRLVLVPCLNAHKRHVRDPLYSFNSLHGRAGAQGARARGLPAPSRLHGSVVAYRQVDRFRHLRQASTNVRCWEDVGRLTCGIRGTLAVGIFSAEYSFILVGSLPGPTAA